MENKILWLMFYIKNLTTWLKNKLNKSTKVCSTTLPVNLWPETKQEQLTLFPYCKEHDSFYSLDGNKNCVICESIDKERHEFNLKLAKRYTENPISASDVNSMLGYLPEITKDNSLQELYADNWFCVRCKQHTTNKYETCSKPFFHKGFYHDFPYKGEHVCVPVSSDIY